MFTKTFLALLFLCVPIGYGQTSQACTATGYCGNSQTNSSVSTSNSNILYGIPFTVNFAASVTDIRDYFGGVAGNAVLVIVCDSNISGTTIGNSAPCPSNNVICSVASFTPTANVTNAKTPTNCGTLSTSVRYWILTNSDNASMATGTTTTGTNVSAYFIANACCTVPSSITGALTSTGELLSLGVTLGNASSAPAPVRRPLIL